MIIFRSTLYIALGICAIGLLYRTGRWFRINVSPHGEGLNFADKLIAVVKKIIAAVKSPRILLLPYILIFDVILQVRILKTDVLRWIMHVSLFFGFTMLTLMHAMDELITWKIFPDYASTQQPFFFLRNLFGVIALIGVCIAIYRRIRFKGPFLQSRFSDKYAVACVAVIMFTGFIVDGAKIISEPAFNRMVDIYYVGHEQNEIEALKACWETDYNVVFKKSPPSSPEILAMGRRLNEDFCSSCHAKPTAAFVSLPLSHAMKPAAVFMNETRADVLIYWIHVFACFIMLAYLPFSKFFHILSDPLLMIVNGISDKKQKSDPAASLPRRALELDACTQCGTCSRYCSVAPVYRVLGNEEILPSEKMLTAFKRGKGKTPAPGFMADIAEGAYICTECFRCTDVCPTGINLQDHWMAQKKSAADEGFVIPQVQVKNQTAAEWAMKLGGDEPGKDAVITEQYRRLSDKNASFEACIQCQTCTNVCPVVACNVDSANAVDITPQKIMNLLRMGLRDMALGSRMVWDCTTCYQCQENCPQGIHVTDIIYELKNMAYSAITELKYQAADPACSGSCCCGPEETKKK